MTTVMPRTAEALTVAIYTDDPPKEVHASSQFVVMEGESLPDLLLDSETMALMGIWVNPVTWEASYLSHPYRGDSHIVVLHVARPMA